MAPMTSGQNLIQLLTSMRQFGVGVNARRSVWKNPGCYWNITRVKLNRDNPYTNGKAWGIKFWNGKQIGIETRIGGVHKKQWQLDDLQSDSVSLRRIRPRQEVKEGSEDTS